MPTRLGVTRFGSLGIVVALPLRHLGSIGSPLTASRSWPSRPRPSARNTYSVVVRLPTEDFDAKGYVDSYHIDNDLALKNFVDEIKAP